MKRLLVLCILFFMTLPVQAQDIFAPVADRYAVSGITIDQATENPATARDAALIEASKLAYGQLKDRFALEGTTLPDLDDAQLSRAMQDFSIDGEKISANRYIGTFTIRFRPSVATGTTAIYKPEASAPTTGVFDVPVTFGFANLTEWQTGRTAIANASGVQGMQIAGLRRNYVDLTVRTTGDADSFMAALAAQGIQASPPAAGVPDQRWFLRLGR